MAEKSTSMATIVRLLLKELRQERGIQQAQIAQMMGKTTSAWSKVEAGETPLTLDHLFTACSAMQIWPANFLVTVQNYTSLLMSNGWFVNPYGAMIEKEDDSLWVVSEEFYAGKLFPASLSINNFPVLNTPWPSPNMYAPIRVFEAAISK